MDVKDFFSKVLASILGIVILTSLVKFPEFILLTIYFLIFKFQSINYVLWLIYLLIVLSTLISGIYLGLRSYKTKNIWYSIFKPTKNKVIISAVISLAILILSIALRKGDISSFTIYNFEYIPLFFSIPLIIISYFVFFYPFSALCNFIYISKDDELFKKSKAIIIILLIILNPIFVIISSSMIAIYHNEIVNEPCGQKIIAFTEVSPAQYSGMRVNEIIIKVDNDDISSFNDLKEYMDNYTPPNDLIIYTESNSYSVKPIYQDNRYILGVNLTQEMCKRSFRK